MSLSEELKWRGFVNQTTLKDLGALDGEPLKFYLGVDPSSDSMTVGNLAAVMMVRSFIAAGHKAVLLVGGATGLIGDPDGKGEERELKSRQEVEANKAAIAAQYKQILGDLPFEIVDNYDWFKDIKYVDFLRDVGKHFSLTQMLDRDFIKSRIGQGGSGISYAEFSYSLIQGYDFLHLYQEKGVTLQVSGADQWGNSLTGVDLIRKLEGVAAHVYTTPLIINKATGRKFGKSEEGTVWLDEDKTSVYQFYQFWLNVDDDGVVDYLKVYTLLSHDQIDRLARENIRTPSDRVAQKTLAFEVTKLVHGEERAESVRKVTEVLFGGGDVSQLSQDELDLLAAEIPTVSFGLLSDKLIENNLVSSKGDFRRFVDSGAIQVNGQKITDDQEISQTSLVKKGKNSFILVL